MGSILASTVAKRFRGCLAVARLARSCLVICSSACSWVRAYLMSCVLSSPVDSDAVVSQSASSSVSRTDMGCVFLVVDILDVVPLHYIYVG